MRKLPEHCPRVAYIHPRPEGRYGHAFGIHEHQDGTGDLGTIPSCESEGCAALDIVPLGSRTLLDEALKMVSAYADKDFEMGGNTDKANLHNLRLHSARTLLAKAREGEG